MDLVCPFDRFIFVADDASSRTSDERRAIYELGHRTEPASIPGGAVGFFALLRCARRSGQVTVSACTSIGTQYVGELGGPTRPYGEAYIVYLGAVERFAVGSTVGAGSGPGSYGAAR